MILLAISLATVLGLMFGMIAIATMPAATNKVIQQRLAAIPATVATAQDANGSGTRVLRDEEAERSLLQSLLENYASADTLRQSIVQGGGTETPSGVFILSIALAAAGGIVIRFFVPFLPLDLGASAIFGFLPTIYIFWRRSKRITDFASALPEAIDMMARALRAGHSIAAAIEIVSQDASPSVASEFEEVFRQQNFGMPLRDSLLQMLERMPSQDLRVLVTAIIVQRDTGGNLVDLLDRTALTIRERLQLRNEIRTHTAQGRLTGWVLCVLPVVMLIFISIMNPGYADVLFIDPFGRKLVYLGIGLLAAGTITINRIIHGIDL